jgi:hypothetical protein
MPKCHPARGVLGGSLRPFWTALAVVLALALAGCGDDDSDTDGFSQGYNSAIERLSQVNQELAGLRNSRSTKAIAHEFDDFATALQSTRADLSGLKPPSEALDEFNAVLAALDDAVRASRRAAHAARAIRPAGQRRAVRDLQRAAEELSEAEDALRRAVQSGGG